MEVLAGLKVLDLSRVLAAPYAAQMLADFGATVWKVESMQGDDARNWGAHYYAAGNRGKQSLVVNLKNPRGRDIVRSLATQADVLIENYKAGDLARYGLGYAELAALNPRLIYASMTGFGQTGPRREQLGYDTLLQGITGIMSVTGDADRPPAKVGIAWIDVMAGLVASTGIFAALRARDQSGQGQHLDLSLFDVGMAGLVDAGLDYLFNGRVQQRSGSIHRNFAPSEPFQTSDGGWVTMAVGNNDQFARLCSLLGLNSLVTDPRFVDNAERLRHRQALADLLAPAFLQRTRSELIHACGAGKVPVSPIHDIRDALSDPQSEARGVVWSLSREDGSTAPSLANPLRHMSATPPRAKGPVPRAGEHTQAVLKEVLGMDEDTLRALAEEGAIAGEGLEARSSTK
jgi:crotonobetainyl-CoA:carnitine CoA-transferase CaiB-like acyl-CoA transferase